MKTFNLTDNQHKLLLSILEEANEYRENMSCNDPYENEKDLLTIEERKEIMRSMFSTLDDDELEDPCIGNDCYVKYIIDIFK